MELKYLVLIPVKESHRLKGALVNSYYTHIDYPSNYERNINYYLWSTIHSY